nr:hypothetical protein [Streptomyces rhizosphaericus]
MTALVGARIGGAEAHVLSALEMGIHPPESFGRLHRLPKERLAAVMDGLRERGLVDTDGRFTDARRETKQRIEALTDELAARPYDALFPTELDELVTELEPITATRSPRGHSDEQRPTGGGVRRPGAASSRTGIRTRSPARGPVPASIHRQQPRPGGEPAERRDEPPWQSPPARLMEVVQEVRAWAARATGS